MISGKIGTYMNGSAMPFTISPETMRYSLLGNWKTWEGPKSMKAMKCSTNERSTVPGRPSREMTQGVQNEKASAKKERVLYAIPMNQTDWL